MAVKTVQFTLNGQTYNLTYDSASGKYKATITAPGTTSWNENDDHKFHGTVVAEDDGGNKTTATVADFSDLAPAGAGKGQARHFRDLSHGGGLYLQQQACL